MVFAVSLNKTLSLFMDTAGTSLRKSNHVKFANYLFKSNNRDVIRTLVSFSPSLFQFH